MTLWKDSWIAENVAYPVLISWGGKGQKRMRTRAVWVNIRSIQAHTKMQTLSRKNKKMWQIGNEELPVFLSANTAATSFPAYVPANMPELGAFLLTQVRHSNSSAWAAFPDIALRAVYALHRFRFLNHLAPVPSSCFLPSILFTSIWF